MIRANIKGFVVGLLFMCILLVSISALADGGTRTIEVNYSNIKITLDGKQITPRDGKGDIVEPFTYNGTTYLPVRGIATALGLAVDWDSTTNTVLLGTGIVSGDWNKDNPAPIGTKINIDYGANKWKGAMFVSQVLRGEDALEQFNQKLFELNRLTENQEVVLAKVLIETSPDSPTQWSYGLTQFFSGYSGYTDILVGAYYGAPDGGDGYIWRAYIVDKSDTQPKLTFKPFGVDNVWFKLY